MSPWARPGVEALARQAGAQLLAPGVLLLQGDAVTELAALLARATYVHRTRDGGSLRAGTRAVCAVVAQAAEDVLRAALPERAGASAAVSASGHADVRESGDPARCPEPDPVWIGTGDAARLLDVTTRQVRRLVVALGGRRGPGRAWLLERAEVEAAAVSRAHRDDPHP